ncbi:M20 metallopeptidase family protein [Thermoactinomyces mirandus]|uniref:Amidohydrolase n=1 Tax=Thermoactinomyces mirandus TaxID=2756294 RepID=A0A7W2AQL9_9BACL|nr:amidohydrolase [Thermoactinomyces mirandus]MBA4601432.1 amidohydrolase [Thermoactinomyces mirandus]
MTAIKNRLNHLFPKMREWRRHFHQFPELSFQEQKTAQIVADHLRQLQLEVQTGVGGHGVTGLLKGKKPGVTVALRADMDALPIQDQKTCAYRSKVPGVMHACGHDGHMAMMMGVAELLAEFREQLSGTVLFIFQPAEELVPGGANAMIEDGVLEDVDLIYGVHLWTPLPYGVIGTRPGELMAAADSFEIRIKGRGGHGGLPHEAVDAVQIAAQLVVNLQSIISRQIDPLDSGVLTVGTIHAGQAFNVIAESCHLQGTVRTFKEEVRRHIQYRLEEITKATCRMYGASHECRYQQGYPALANEEKAVSRIREAARKIVGKKNVWDINPLMASEDFSYYLQKRPGAFCFVGAGNKENFGYPHHHPLFDFDEQAMRVGAELLIRLVLAEAVPYVCSSLFFTELPS